MNDQFKAIFLPSITSIMTDAIAELRKAVEHQNVTQPQHQQQPTSTTTTVAPRQYSNRQPKPTCMSEKQSLFLMHTYERILAKTYEQEKYTTYQNFIGRRTPKETIGITAKYIKHILKKTPTDQDLNNTDNQAAAFKIHLENTHNYLKEQKEAAAKMLSFLDCTSTTIIANIQEALTKANNNTLYIKHAAHKDIYQFIANITIQEIHQELKSSLTPEDYQNYEKYIELSKLMNTNMRKISTLQNHLDNDTVPTYMTNNYKHEWHGPTLTDETKKLWDEANLEAMTHMLDATINILKENHSHLIEKIKATNIAPSTENNNKVKALLFINNHRQKLSTSSETSKSFIIPNSFKEIMRVNTSSYNTMNIANLFQDNTPIEPSYHHIITEKNFSSFVPLPTKPQVNTIQPVEAREKFLKKALPPIVANTPLIPTSIITQPIEATSTNTKPKPTAAKPLFSENLTTPTRTIPNRQISQSANILNMLTSPLTTTSTKKRNLPMTSPSISDTEEITIDSDLESPNNKGQPSPIKPQPQRPSKVKKHQSQTKN